MNLLNFKSLAKIASFATLLISISSAQAELVNNGSLTGPIGHSLPAGWVNGNTVAAFSNSPDTMDALNNVGVANLLDFGATPSASPNGGTWVGIARNGPLANESFAQTISTFTVGKLYTLSWYDANFGIDSFGYNKSNQFVASLFNANSQLSFVGASRPLAPGWSLNSFDFVATQSQYTLQFSLVNPNNKSYLSIDGISIDFSKNDPVTTPVPEPSTWAFMLAGVLMIGFQIRKQKMR